MPAKNEAAGLALCLPKLRLAFPDAELIVVDDGSSDATADVAVQHGARVIRHPISMGNGAAIKTGARHALGRRLVFLDADGQHDPEDARKLLDQLDQGYAMAVGARDGTGQANLGRHAANALYNWLATQISNYPVKDLTSGFRAVDAAKFRQFLALLPNGFSYPTTITMAFLRSGYPVAYLPIHVAQRIGRSHIRPIRDGFRFFLIIFKVATLFSPLKLFVPIATLFGVLGAANYAQTYLTEGRFTNMSVLLFSAAVIVMLIGLISEQITGLLYSSLRDSGDG
jgi:glycosyltransferase involved in cell wall biosynthesis